MKHIHQDQPGDVNVLQIKESPIPQLKQDHVLMKISYCAMNRAEVLQRQGKVPVTPGHTPIIGLEASGYIVDEKGNELYPAMGLFSGGSYAYNGMKIYQIDQIMVQGIEKDDQTLIKNNCANKTLNNIIYKNNRYAPIHKDHVIELPKNLTLEQGGAIPEAWITAYQLIKYIGQVQKDEYVMIYAGASGVGTAAIQLAKYFGAHPIVSSSADDKLKTCAELGAELCLNYKTNQNQAEEIMKFTNGKGINIVLDCVGAQNYELTDKIMALDARWIIYGTMGGFNIENFNLGSLMRRRIQLTTTLLNQTIIFYRSRTDAYKADLISKFKNDTLKGFEEGILKPIVDRVIPITWDEEGLKGWRLAHTVMESNQNIGKIVVAYPKI